jgi:hypothetical protein
LASCPVANTLVLNKPFIEYGRDLPIKYLSYCSIDSFADLSYEQVSEEVDEVRENRVFAVDHHVLLVDEKLNSPSLKVGYEASVRACSHVARCHSDIGLELVNVDVDDACGFHAIQRERKVGAEELCHEVVDSEADRIVFWAVQDGDLVPGRIAQMVCVVGDHRLHRGLIDDDVRDLHRVQLFEDEVGQPLLVVLH